jgi:hypothetical protein
MDGVVAPALLRAAGDAELDAAYWQSAFDADPSLFAALDDGARMGLIVDGECAPAGRRRGALDAVAARYAGGPMFAFSARDGRIAVTVERFQDFAAANLDLVFIADDEARAALGAAAPAATLRTMKRLIRRGNVLFFVLRTKHELQGAGYEDFLDSIGIPFLGSCR